MWGDLRASRQLAWRLVVRDISSQYRQTAFGYLWAVLPPVLITLVWVLLNRSAIVRVNAGSLPYPVYVLTGTIFWQLFVDALNAPLKQLSSNRSLLSRVRFPTEALLLSGGAQVLFSFAIKLAVLVGLLIVYRVSVEWTAVFLVFPIAGVLAVGTVLGVLVAPLGMLYKDIDQALLLIVGPLMFLTPVVYPVPATGTLATIMNANPLTPLLNMARDMLYTGGTDAVAGSGLVAGVTVAAAGIGWLVYRLALPILVERLDA
jgi:lipopolysaccharide transport system permease protein